MKQQTKHQSSSGLNWYLIGGIIAVGALALIVLLVMTAGGGEGINLSDAATQTAVAQTSLNALGQELATYCQTNTQRCFAKGDANAPVTVFEFSDYACPHCRDFTLDGNADAIDAQYVQTGQVRWVNVPYALRQDTLPPAAAAICAGEQGKLFEFQHTLFGQQSESNGLAREGLVKAATAVGLDLNAFESCIDSGRYTADVNANMRLAAQSGLEGTPTFFVNGQKVAGNDLAGLQRLINASLAQ